MIKNKMEKNSQVTLNDNDISILKKNFAGCFNKDGSFDLSKFENQINGKINITKEGYDLNFLGKSYAKLLSVLNTETTIKPDEENNNIEDNKNSNNVYITGDNLDALKHLINSYANKIKCIYIDPPYNTGSDGFVYNDKFNFDINTLISKLDITEEEAKKILDMTNKGSASHSAWLTFMYPRLYLAKQLLSEDGVIFISIDDNEQANLKILCDGIFGEENFKGIITVVSNPRGRDYGGIAKMHDYLLVYTKSHETILNKLSDKEGEFRLFDEIGGFELRELRNRNIKFNNNNRPNLYYPFYVNPQKIDKNKLYEISLEKIDNFIEVFPAESQGVKTVWRWGKQKSANNLNINIKAKKMKDGRFQIAEKYRDATTMARSVWWDKDVNTEKGTLLVKSMFNSKVFDYPKTIEMIKRIIEMSTSDDSEDIILDFFSGSATTAHAVMQLNAEDGGNKKYIMVQLPEKCNKDSEAYKAGYKTIDEIGMERIRLASKKIKEETNADIDYGFKHYVLEDVNTNTLDKLETFDPNAMFSDSTILDEFGTNTVLTTWMIEDGYGFNASYEEIILDSYKAYKCVNTLYLIDEGLDAKDIKILVEKYEKDKDFDCNRLVIFGYSFGMSELQMLHDNLKQIKNFKGTEVEIITRY